MPSTVIPRNGRYGARAFLGGQQVWLGTFSTRREAERAVSEAVRTYVPPPQKVYGTVRAWDEAWMELYPGNRNAQTAAHNRQMCRPFVRKYGSRKLDSITPLEAQAWAIRNPGSVRYLRLMFAKALRAEIVERNVWLTVEVPSQRRAQEVPSVAMVDRLVEVCRARGNDHFADCILFAAYSGLRLSEVAGVQASDVHGDRVVVRSAKRRGGEEVRARLAAVMGPGREALARQVPEVGIVWHTATGRPLTRESVGRLFRPVAEEAGHGGTFHSLRKFNATWLRDQGADPRDIAQHLGHVDRSGRPYPDLVDRVYASPSADAALQRLEALAG